MALLPQSLDATDRDFMSMRSRLIALLQSTFPDWSDFSTASFGNILLEMYAFVGDVITYYLDNQSRESRLSTATQRKNVIALARMLGYKLHGAAAATAEVRFELPKVPEADVLFPAGTIVRTQEVTEPVRFQLLSGVTISTGQTPPIGIGVVEHSRLHAQYFDSQGLPHFDLALEYTPYLDGSARVSAANGLYTEQESLLGSGPNDRHFTLLVDQNDRATVRFGNGVGGTIPSGTIAVMYKTGGGKAGNVDANRIVVLEQAVTDSHGRPVQVKVSNPSRATGGVDRQSIASAKLLAPESLRATNRTVSREDFEINARRVPGVARALMLTSNEDKTIRENTGILFVVPEGGGLPTSALKKLVLKEVTEVRPCTLTFQVNVQDPVYKSVNIETRIYLRQGYDPISVGALLKKRLREYFRISNSDGTPNSAIDFGFNIKDSYGDPVGEVALSDVFNVIRDTHGVRKMGADCGDLTLNGLPADVKLSIQELPVLGNITLINGDTGEFL